MLAFQIASDPGVTMRGFWALGLWHQGYPDRASVVTQEVLRHARRPDAHPYHSRGLGLLLNGMAAIAARRISEAPELGSEAIAVGNEHGLPTILGTGLILQGWALARRGSNGAAVEGIRNGITLARYHSYIPIFLGLLAEALIVNYVGFYIFLLLVVPPGCLMLVLEERELVDRFGDAYRKYQRDVPCIFPRLRGKRRVQDS